MAVSPINVATKGYLKSPLAVAVSGYLGGIFDSIPPLPWLGGALVLPPTYGIAMVASTLGSIVGSVYASMISVVKNVDTTTQGEPGVEVKDQEPGT